jgi:hypothetical protein
MKSAANDKSKRVKCSRGEIAIKFVAMRWSRFVENSIATWRLFYALQGERL